MKLDGMSPIGDVVKSTPLADGLLIDAKGGSQVKLTVLAPDLIRVRAVIGKGWPADDTSWAIEKTEWPKVRFDRAEDHDGIHLITDELDVVVHRSPLTIEMRDKSGNTIVADAKPMMADAKGRLAVAKKVPLEEHFYGLGEKADRLDKRRQRYTMWSRDFSSYDQTTDPIYQSIPFYVGWDAGHCYGLFYDNSYKTRFDLASTQDDAVFLADGGDELDYYFFQGPSMKKVVERYTELTGRMPMWPRWALGNQQCRWSYWPADRAAEIVSRYREEHLPLDVIYLDIDYMDGYRVFTWGPGFPDPKKFVADQAAKGVKVVTIIDPGVKYQPEGGYRVFDEGKKSDYFLKSSDGKLFVGEVWPGKSVWVDYTKPAARAWWGGLHSALLDAGVAGVWNDMNEPSDFLDQTGGRWADVVNDDLGRKSKHAKMRNLFAMLEDRATYEGLKKLENGKRPYVITRSGYAGVQRYATMWTGDNQSHWADLGLTLPMFASLGISGESFVGSDAGGFNGRGSGELLTRWYEAAFLMPMCRNHKGKDGYDQEPWRFGGDYEAIIRKYLELRYRLLPYLYTTLEEAHRTGVPAVRALILEHPEDADAVDVDDEVLIGGDLLIAPVMREGATERSVYLPKGTWVDWWSGRRVEGGHHVQVSAPLETVPLFVRAGAVIPTGPVMEFTGEKPVDPLTFEVWADDTGAASGSAYEDDGETFAFEQGALRRTRVSVANGKISIAAVDGSWTPAAPRHLAVHLHGANAGAVTLDGKPLAAAAAEGAVGWRADGDGFTATIADDGAAHEIAFKAAKP